MMKKGESGVICFYSKFSFQFIILINFKCFKVYWISDILDRVSADAVTILFLTGKVIYS